MSALHPGMFIIAALLSSQLQTEEDSLGLRMVRIEPGTFSMGSEEGDWDESPVHKVTISQPYRISATEVTLGQYCKFRPEHRWVARSGAVTGVSWHDAVAFCEWLSRKAGKPYRLPTEAEWEYASRLNQSDHPPGSEGKLRLKGMEDETAEWCYDWHGPYRSEDQVDPIGPDAGLARVVRGDKIDHSKAVLPWRQGNFYHRSANRAGAAPAFGVPAAPDDVADVGRHRIGFRVVQAPRPLTQPYPAELPQVRRGVKQTTADAARRFGADPKRPYFRKRSLLPSPPETITGRDMEQAKRHRRVIDAAGLPPTFCGHNHSPALATLPNGDLLMAIFTSWTEYEPDMSILFARLRLGADQWEMPDLLVDFPDACDNCPLLWTDGAEVYFFWANTNADGGYPFNWISSSDCGATWTQTQFPRFTGPIGPHSRQPINSVLRDRDGRIYVASDAAGASSVLWQSADGMKTWLDSGGRTGGRHTTFVLLEDGRSILGIGGKNSNLGGFMPQSVSSDGGKSWQMSPTPFSPLGGNQRPCVLRLQSGRLFFCADFQRSHDGARAPGVQQDGAFVALSDDEGRTWHTKRLAGTQRHEDSSWYGPHDTIGYSVACQAPNGIIHLITTMNEPCLHFEMNEAWIRSAEPMPNDASLTANTATSIGESNEYRENDASGRTRLVWHAGVASDGRYLLDGAEIWYYPDGSKQYEATYKLGRKVGVEVLYRTDGSRTWQWGHEADGTSRWTQWWPNGMKKAESTWKGLHADGPARTWNPQGAPVSEVLFSHGRVIQGLTKRG